jgi:hypothetical protein
MLQVLLHVQVGKPNILAGMKAEHLAALPMRPEVRSKADAFATLLEEGRATPEACLDAGNALLGALHQAYTSRAKESTPVYMKPAIRLSGVRNST